MELFKAVDDQGILGIGNKNGAIAKVINWTKSAEAKDVYTQSELNKIRTYFKENAHQDFLEFFGFRIEPLNS